jgi:hypothetical protein
MTEKRDVLVQAPAATRVRIKTAAVALGRPGLLHLDIIMQSGEASGYNRSKGQLNRRRKDLAATVGSGALAALPLPGYRQRRCQQSHLRRLR